MDRDLNFSSPESLAVELDQAGVRLVWVNYLAYSQLLEVYQPNGEYEPNMFLFLTGVVEAV